MPYFSNFFSWSLPSDFFNPRPFCRQIFFNPCPFAITKISNLEFRKLFYSHNFNMDKVSLHAKFHAYSLLCC